MSVYKDFRSVIGPSGRIAQFNSLSKRFDEPTYLSFLLVFKPAGNYGYNNASNSAYYDFMPHPLFQDGAPDNTSVYDLNSYSAIDYLNNANEPTRAAMLKEFITKFNQLQENAQWYFQKIDGVGDLLKVDTKKGQRVTSDKRLTVTCLEGLDLRMSHLLNLYKKIAWDDTWQRWVLPDMMRYFLLDIYVTEFRTFHTPNQYNTIGSASIQPTSNVMAPATGNTEMILKIFDNMLPTWKITCEMCEFDIESLGWNFMNSLTVTDATEPASVTFQIKVGNIKEMQIYPMFLNTYLEDRKLNGPDRSKDLVTTISERPTDGKFPGNDNRGYPTDLQVGQTQFKETESYHISGMPYVERANQSNMIDRAALDPGPDGIFGTDDDPASPFSKVDPTRPNTWVGNAVKFGTSFAKNFVEQKIDVAKITPINVFGTKLGISFNQLQAALESKNIITALGMIKTASDTIAASYVGPSSRLNGDISQHTFRNVLVGISRSEATNNSQRLIKEAAGLALDDITGTWEKLKDFSLATDLVGSDEKNIPKIIQNKDEFRQITLQDSNYTTSTATSSINRIVTGGIIESSPSR
jgi:hypothetical protein